MGYVFVETIKTSVSERQVGILCGREVIENIRRAKFGVMIWPRAHSGQY